MANSTIITLTEQLYKVRDEDNRETERGAADVGGVGSYLVTYSKKLINLTAILTLDLV